MKLVAHEIRRPGGRDGGAGNHHDGCDLRLGDELAVGKYGRRDPAADDVDLVVDDHLLHEPAGVVGHTAIVAHDDFDLLAGDHVAVVLHVEPCAGPGLPTRSSETGPGHGKAHADLDHILRRRRSGDERERGGGRDGEPALHVSLPLMRLVVPLVL